MKNILIRVKISPRPLLLQIKQPFKESLPASFAVFMALISTVVTYTVPNLMDKWSLHDVLEFPDRHTMNVAGA